MPCCALSFNICFCNYKRQEYHFIRTLTNHKIISAFNFYCHTNTRDAVQFNVFIKMCGFLYILILIWFVLSWPFTYSTWQKVVIIFFFLLNQQLHVSSAHCAYQNQQIRSWIFSSHVGRIISFGYLLIWHICVDVWREWNRVPYYEYSFIPFIHRWEN